MSDNSNNVTLQEKMCVIVGSSLLLWAIIIAGMVLLVRECGWMQ